MKNKTTFIKIEFQPICFFTAIQSKKIALIHNKKSKNIFIKLEKKFIRFPSILLLTQINVLYLSLKYQNEKSIFGWNL